MCYVAQAPTRGQPVGMRRLEFMALLVCLDCLVSRRSRTATPIPVIGFVNGGSADAIAAFAWALRPRRSRLRPRPNHHGRVPKWLAEPLALDAVRNDGEREPAYPTRCRSWSK
jgi:hypothetical protein